jgi:hypothetical protein
MTSSSSGSAQFSRNASTLLTSSQAGASVNSPAWEPYHARTTTTCVGGVAAHNPGHKSFYDDLEDDGTTASRHETGYEPGTEDHVEMDALPSAPSTSTGGVRDGSSSMERIWNADPERDALPRSHSRQSSSEGGITKVVDVDVRESERPRSAKSDAKTLWERTELSNGEPGWVRLKGQSRR